jgi:hypothetical protein
MQTGAAVYFASEPMKVGKHEWRVLVYESEYHGRCTQYEWRIIDPPWQLGCHGHDWRDHARWPTYDGNKGYSGLPKTLQKLYVQNMVAIKATLRGEPISAGPVQAELFG